MFTPDDAIARCGGGTLRDDVTGPCGWPLLSELRGKWIDTIGGRALPASA
jgi:hypothetical protein